jgi:hypothetical protein
MCRRIELSEAADLVRVRVGGGGALEHYEPRNEARYERRQVLVMHYMLRNGFVTKGC